MAIEYNRSLTRTRHAVVCLLGAMTSCLVGTGVLAVTGCGVGVDDGGGGATRHVSAAHGQPADQDAADSDEATTSTDAAADGHSSDEHEYTNRLIDSTSPYLLQHAHNPVDWYPWGEEAIQRAKRENKPIFLSVGYSTCYWCHVMEREVFEDPDIAALMNDLFINIKVDREQRPDIDEVYMTATRLMTRRGGWPNSVFLTPDLKPFFAGTYFGPTDQAGRPGFPRLIRAIADAWANDREQVIATADRAADAIRRALSQAAPGTDAAQLTTAIPDQLVAQLRSRYDAQHGGFGGAPKFPQDFYYEFLFDVHDRTGEQPTRNMALHTLRMMAAGGIYDHVGGGFHRYSTDAQWRVPHFEKMLYNQAQLTVAYIRAYETTGDPAFADVVRGTLRYVDEMMTGPDGQFYSALDAETDAVEGAYYVWNRSGIRNILDSEEMEFFDEIFALGDVPEFPGHKHPDGGVLYMRKPITDLADDLGRPYQEIRRNLDALLRKLKNVRDKRKLPRLDDKVIVAWNGLMIRAYAEAGEALDEPSYIESAEQAARFILDHLRDPDGRLLRIWRDGDVVQPAFHEDYAFLIRGLLALHHATGDAAWLDHAVELARSADEKFWDSEDGGYYFTQESRYLIARSKSVSDGAIPSGNSVMLHNLVELRRATGDEFWEQRVKQMLQSFSGSLSGAPMGLVHMVHGLERWLKLRKLDANRMPADITLPDIDDPSRTFAPLGGDEEVATSVSVDPARVRPGSVFLVHVDLAIAEGWHINANPASGPQLIPTLVGLRGDAPVEVRSVEYPEAQRLDASYADKPLAVFAGRNRITMTARLKESAAVGERLTLNVLLQYQACDDSRCLPPTERINQVEIAVEK